MVILNYFWLFFVILTYFTLIIFVYHKLFHPRLFLAILSNSNIWLLVVILLVPLVLINGYWYLLYLWLLMFFSGYFINGH
jgi:hypothetical protein